MLAVIWGTTLNLIRVERAAAVGLAPDPPVPASEATPERLQAQVFALRGEWR